MELRQLRYVEAIARLGSVTRAAEELHIAQPSLSKQIQNLEQELGVALFNRVGRGIELADAGVVFVPYIRRILQEVEAAVEALQARQDLSSGHVSIGVSPTVGTRLLPDALAAFHAIYSGIELELHETGANDLLQLLDRGIVDIAIVSVPVSTMRWIELFTEELVVAVSKQHRLAEQTAIEAAALHAERWILFPEGYELRQQTLELCATAGFEPRIVLDGGEMNTVLQLAAAGLGIAIVPRLALETQAGLHSLSISDQLIHRTLSLIWHPERPLTPAAHALQTFLVERLRRVSRPLIED